jgi:hypothetical protein
VLKAPSADCVNDIAGLRRSQPYCPGFTVRSSGLVNRHFLAKGSEVSYQHIGIAVRVRIVRANGVFSRTIFDDRTVPVSTDS